MNVVKQQVLETTKSIAQALNLKEGSYSNAFQSRLANEPWLKPYTDQSLKGLANKGFKKMLVFSPAFVADCLETTIEIGEEYLELFKEHGGEKIQLVPSLNDNDDAQGLYEIIKEKVKTI